MSSTISKARNDSSWINVAKACAIVGVVLQHVSGLLYSDQRIFYSVWWVVALFIMIGGYNAMSSYKNRGYVVMKRRLLGIGIPYVVATIIYQIHHFNFYETCLALCHFDASGPLYYVAVYLQLALITPVLISIIRYCEAGKVKRRYVVTWFLLIVLCLWSSDRTNIMDIGYGGGRLFGGPWLFFWFAGMFIRMREDSVKSFVGREYRIILSSVLLAVWEYVFVVEGHNLEYAPLFPGSGVGLTWANTLETFIIFFWFRDVVSFVESKKSDLGQIMIRPLNYVGRHTLYIFLYHKMFVSIPTKAMSIVGIPIMDSPCALIGAAFIVFLPIAVEIGMGKIKIAFENFMTGVKVV